MGSGLRDSRVCGFGLRDKDSGFRVHGSEFGVEGLGFRVEVLEFGF